MNYDDTSHLESIPYQEYKKDCQENNQKISEQISDNIKVIDENNNVLYEPKNQTIKNIIKNDIDGGNLEIKTTLYTIKSNLPSNYMVVSEFQWKVSPKYRGTDYFGITRGSNTASVPKKFQSYFAYTELPIEFFATSNGIVTTKLDYKNHDKGSLPNKSDTKEGFVIESSLPVDVTPPSQMLVGTRAIGRYYGNIRGGVCYQGVLQKPKDVPQYFNHWSTYIHQEKPILIGKPTLSIPLGASFSIEPSKKYSDPVIDEVLHVWNKKIKE